MSNKGCVAINVFIPEDIHKTFKMLALLRNMTYRELLCEAMDKLIKDDKDQVNLDK